MFLYFFKHLFFFSCVKKYIFSYKKDFFFGEKNLYFHVLWFMACPEEVKYLKTLDTIVQLKIPSFVIIISCLFFFIFWSPYDLFLYFQVFSATVDFFCVQKIFCLTFLLILKDNQTQKCEVFDLHKLILD